jgi:ankyrin repeat protein
MPGVVLPHRKVEAVVLALLALLCERGADLCRARDPQGNSALHWACFRGFAGVARELAKLAAAKGDVDAANAAGETALHW